MITAYNPIVAQLSYEPFEKAFYFSYGLRLKDKGLSVHQFQENNSFAVVMYPRLPQILYALDFTDVSVKVNFLTPDSLKHFQNRNLAPTISSIKEMFTADSVRVKQIKSASTDDFDLKLYKVRTINYSNKRKGKGPKVLNRNKSWILSSDTIFDKALHVEIWSNNDSRMMGKRAFRRMKKLRLEPLDVFPDFEFKVKSDSLYWIDSLGFVKNKKENLLTQLPCMDRASLYDQYFKIHSADLDSLLENFLYEELADSIVSRQYLLTKKKYIDGNSYLQKHYEELVDISLDRIVGIHRNLLDMKYGLDQFQNFLNKNHVATVFDTLALLKARFKMFEDKISLSALNYRSEIDNFRREVHLDVMSQLENYEFPMLQSINVENDMLQLIHRQYLQGNGYVYGRRHLLDFANKDVYVFDPADSNLTGNILVTLTEQAPGKWQVQLDTINLGFDANMLSEMVPFNNKLLFKMYGDYIILDTTQSPFTFQQIKIFPDSLFDHPVVCNVKSSFELYSTTIQDFVDNTPKEYSLAEWPIHGNRAYNNEFLQSMFHPNDIIYIHKDIKDINADGTIDIYSFAIVNGQVVFSQCYIEKEGELIELDDTSRSQFLGDLNLYRNMITYSSMGNKSTISTKSHD